MGQLGEIGTVGGLERRAGEAGAALGNGLTVGDERLLERDDRDLDHVVGGTARRDRLDPDARQEQRTDDRVPAVARSPAEDLVADGGDDRDEQDAAPDHDDGVLPPD